jgi:hypothetical protein
MARSLTGDECVDIVALVCDSSLYKRSAQGEIESIAHQGDPARGGGAYRLAFGAVVNEADELVTIGDLTSPPNALQTLGVFVNSRGRTTAVARPGDAVPGGGHFVTTGQFSYGARLNNRSEARLLPGWTPQPMARASTTLASMCCRADSYARRPHRHFHPWCRDNCASQQSVIGERSRRFHLR